MLKCKYTPNWIGIDPFIYSSWVSFHLKCVVAFSIKQQGKAGQYSLRLFFVWISVAAPGKAAFKSISES